MGETAVRTAERHGDNGIRNITCTISLRTTINTFNSAKISYNQKEENWCLTVLLPEPQDGIAAALRQLVRHNALYCHLLLRVAEGVSSVENYFL